MSESKLCHYCQRHPVQRPFLCYCSAECQAAGYQQSQRQKRTEGGGPETRPTRRKEAARVSARMTASLLPLPESQQALVEIAAAYGVLSEPRSERTDGRVVTCACGRTGAPVPCPGCGLLVCARCRSLRHAQCTPQTAVCR